MADHHFSSDHESSRPADAVPGSRSPRAGRVALACLALQATLISAAGPLAAQGVTGAAVEGRVTGGAVPLEDAMVLVANTSNGERWRTTTNARGRYFVEYVTVGGPYRIEVRAVGFEPAVRESIFLALGQRLTMLFALTPAVVQLQEITVTGIQDPRLGAARTGPAQIIPDSTIARLPVKGRDYTEMALLSPQVTRSPNGGLSFAGQHDRHNSIQIDGTSNNDPFGRFNSGSGTPGWAVGLNAFTPEAVKELQVVTASFDVRYGSFAGGLINAVTRSGTNRLEGSILGRLESDELIGADPTGSEGGQFSRTELGLTLGAPIVRDRVALFVNADLRQEAIPQSVPVPSSDTTDGADSAGVGIRYESLVRFQRLLRGYEVEPGSFSAGTFRAPTRNLFVKVTAQLGVNNRLAISHNYGHGVVRDGTIERAPGFYPLSSAGSERPETINATRLAWRAAFGGHLSNELILARVDDRHTCHPNAIFPGVSVRADGGELFAGLGGSCLGLENGHTLWEITDNFGITAGSHRLTFGFHGEWIDLVENPADSPVGLWFFDSLGALERSEASGYQRDFVSVVDSQVGFRVNHVGLYVQDQWLPTPHLTLTAGLRLDVPFVPTAPPTNPVAASELGINTALTPSGNAVWSPRLGVNYDPSGRGTTVLRGGAGFFAGPPPYVWFRNVYASNGIRTLTIECFGGIVPDFTLDPNNQPTACADSSETTSPPAYFDPDFRFPQTLKVSLGADHLLPGGVVATLDLLYTRGIHTVQIADVNLLGPIGTAAGEGGRAIYGRFDPVTGQAMPSRRSEALRGVYQLRNGSGDRSYSITAQLGKRFANGTELSGAYTYTDAKDRMSMDLGIAEFTTASTPVNGTLEHRELRTSFWERPHKVTLVATTDLPLGFQFGLTYVGTSGEPYTYVLLGDPNADGFRPDFQTSNDVVYVPRDASDISLDAPATYAELDSIIRSEPCLRNRRGRLLERNTCRDPWVHEAAARLSKTLRIGGRRTLEVGADLFNLLNFMDSDWGVVRRTRLEPGNLVPLMDFLRWDAANGRGVYGPIPVYRREIEVEASRWRLQLGSTLSF